MFNHLISYNCIMLSIIYFEDVSQENYAILKWMVHLFARTVTLNTISFRSVLWLS
jgi:hypothetical protein